MQSAKDLISKRLYEHNDFPAISNTIKIINQFKITEDTSVSEFANIILKDYALTTKVLKLVNSVNYAQFGEVTTISRAIILLGFENIKNLALTLLLFDHFQKNCSNIEFMDTMVKSLYSGILAQKISDDINFSDKEEAFICSLFHNFGKMLVSFALPDKTEEIKLISREKGISEDKAAQSVLGAGYQEVGMEMAREWHFPNKIIHSMHRLSGMEITSTSSDLDKLTGISFFANEISGILSGSTEKKDMDEKVCKLVDRFRPQFGGLDPDLAGIISASLADLNEFSAIFNVTLETVPFNRKLVMWTDKAVEPPAIPQEMVLANLTTEALKTIDIIFESEKEDTPDNIFTKGIQDINSSILSSLSLNDIVRIVLETMYRGMQLSGEAKALFLVKDTKLPVLNIRFGFGSGIEELKKWFNITLGDSGDIFNMAIAKQTDLVIKDNDAPEIIKLLPDWFKSKVSAKIFIVLLPIIVNNKPIGMFYVEGDRDGFQKISGSHFNYLKILRDQTVVGIKQKHW